MTEPIYSPAENRYENGMKYRRCGKSGILLPEISLGLWQNFGDTTPYSRSKAILHHAFDRGIVSYDLANNYGPACGTAEQTFGKVFKESFRNYRDELFISTKAGYDMWPGPYGNWGSRKHLFASLEQSLKRMNLDYVDVFYSHRYDPETPMEETLQALIDIVRSGKALYAAISRWPREKMEFAIEYMASRDVPLLLYQGKLNIFDRNVESEGITELVQGNGIGFIAFSTLAEGLLSNRYLNGIPAGSRADRGSHLKASQITPEILDKIKRLNHIASLRGETLARMATAWVLSRPGVTSVIAGCSSIAQLDDTLEAVSAAPFTPEEEYAVNSAIGIAAE